MDNINIRISDSTFQDHENSAENGRLTWAMQNGKRIMEKNIIEANRACNGTMHSLFQVAYYMRKEVIPFHKFPVL